MPKIPSPWKCSYCDQVKQETNHWYLGYRLECGYSVIAWREALAEDADAHLCGQSCSLKFANEQFDRLAKLERALDVVQKD